MMLFTSSSDNDAPPISAIILVSVMIVILFDPFGTRKLFTEILFFPLRMLFTAVAWISDTNAGNLVGYSLVVVAIIAAIASKRE